MWRFPGRTIVRPRPRRLTGLTPLRRRRRITPPASKTTMQQRRCWPPLNQVIRRYGSTVRSSACIASLRRYSSSSPLSAIHFPSSRSRTRRYITNSALCRWTLHAAQCQSTVNGTLHQCLFLAVSNQKRTHSLQNPMFHKSSTSFILSTMAFCDLSMVNITLLHLWIVARFKINIRRLTSFGCKFHLVLTYYSHDVRGTFFTLLLHKRYHILAW